MPQIINELQGEGAAKEVASLTAVLEELRDREVELKEAISELQKTKATLRNAFQQAVGAAPGPADVAKASPSNLVAQGE